MRKRLVALLIVLVTAVGLFAPVTLSVSPQTQAPQLAANVAYAADNDINFGCRLRTPVNCVPKLFYYTLAAPTAWFAGVVANMLDFFVYYSIRGETYRGFAFIEEGWRMTRDISNIFFIFSLLMIAISIILRVNAIVANPKKLLINVIVVALLINFSLFFTGIIIDASNLLAKSFYSGVKVENSSGEAFTEPSLGALFSGTESPKSITVAVLSKLKVQNLLGEDANLRDLGNIANQIVFLLMITVVNTILIYVFIVVMWLFLARVITLMLAMVLSPFAFITLAIPQGARIPKLGFKSWINTVLSVSFMAPVFMFFMFLILKFVNSQSFIVLNPTEEGFLLTFLQILIPFALVMGLIFAAKQVTVNMSGELAKAAVKGVEGMAKMGATVATGTAIGLGTAAAASAGRQTVGRLGAKIAKKGRALETKRGNSFLGNMSNRFAGQAMRMAGEGAAQSSFDWRTTERGQKIAQSIGLRGAPFLDTRTKQGGFRQSQADFEKRAKERAEATQLQGDDELVQSLDEAAAAFKAIEFKVGTEMEKLKSQETKQRADYNDKNRQYQEARAEAKDAEEDMASAATPEARKDAEERLRKAQERAHAIKAGSANNPGLEEAARLLNETKQKREDLKNAEGEYDNDKWRVEGSDGKMANYKTLEDRKDEAEEKVNNENFNRRMAVAAQSREISGASIIRGGIYGTAAGAALAITGGLSVPIAAALGGAGMTIARSIKEVLDKQSGFRDQVGNKLIKEVKVNASAIKEQTGFMKTQAIKNAEKPKPGDGGNSGGGSGTK